MWSKLYLLLCNVVATLAESCVLCMTCAVMRYDVSCDGYGNGDGDGDGDVQKCCSAAKLFINAAAHASAVAPALPAAPPTAASFCGLCLLSVCVRVCCINQLEVGCSTKLWFTIYRCLYLAHPLSLPLLQSVLCSSPHTHTHTAHTHITHTVTHCRQSYACSIPHDHMQHVVYQILSISGHWLALPFLAQVSSPVFPLSTYLSPPFHLSLSLCLRLQVRRRRRCYALLHLCDSSSVVENSCVLYVRLPLPLPLSLSLSLPLSFCCSLWCGESKAAKFMFIATTICHNYMHIARCVCECVCVCE